MDEARLTGHIRKLSINSINEKVSASPVVPCTQLDLQMVLASLKLAVETNSYYPVYASKDNPVLPDEYVFDAEDEKAVLKDLTSANFVAKIVDTSDSSKKRKRQGLPQEYLYVFKYPCELMRLDAQTSGVSTENVLVYIKIINRIIPSQKVLIISFHKNIPTNF